MSIPEPFQPQDLQVLMSLMWPLHLQISVSETYFFFTYNCFITFVMFPEIFFLKFYWSSKVEFIPLKVKSELCLNIYARKLTILKKKKMNEYWFLKLTFFNFSFFLICIQTHSLFPETNLLWILLNYVTTSCHSLLNFLNVGITFY